MTDYSLHNSVSDSLPQARPGVISQDDRPAALLHALQQQLALFEQLHTLAQWQGSLIGTEDGSPLLALLAQRQQIIDQLQSLQRDADANRLTAAALSSEQAREASELTELIAAVRARILEQDERDRAVLRDVRNQVGIDLRKMTQGGNANKAYGGSKISTSPAAPTLSRFTDRKG